MTGVFQRIVGAVSGAIFGTILLILFFYIIWFFMELFDIGSARFRFPILLLALPIFGAWYGFKFAPDLSNLVSIAFKNSGVNIKSDRYTRLAFVAPLVWLVAAIGYVFLFSPYGYRMREDDYLHLAKVVVFPVLVFWLALWAAYFVNRENESE